MKMLTIKPGTIITYKEYPWYRKLFAKLFHKELKNNVCDIFAEQISIPTRYLELDEDIELYEPVKPYSKEEKNKLQFLSKDYYFSVEEIVNLIREDTIDDIADIDNCKWYKKINLNEVEK